MSIGLYAPSGNGCVGASIVDHGRAGTTTHHAPPFSARTRRAIARFTAALAARSRTCCALRCFFASTDF